jgi:hypothetical protein
LGAVTTILDANPFANFTTVKIFAGQIVEIIILTFFGELATHTIAKQRNITRIGGVIIAIESLTFPIEINTNQTVFGIYFHTFKVEIVTHGIFLSVF